MRIIDLNPADSAALQAQVMARPESRYLEFKRVSGKMVNKALDVKN